MSSPRSLSPSATPMIVSGLDRVTAAIVQRITLAIIMVVALILRTWDLSRLSLWLDELATVTYARLPWTTVSGLNGAYDNHPPLYYALTKAVAVVVPEVLAGRVISAVAGTLTVWVVYATLTTVASPWAGLLAAFALALSPLHVWYSREARMYALVVLFVLLVALMVARSWRDGRPVWAIGAATFATLALYTDYAAVMALVPLGVVVLWRARSDWRRRWLLVAAFLLAGIAYLPWLGQLVQTVESVGSDRSFLALTGERAIASIQSIMGLGGTEAYYWGTSETPVATWPILGVVVLVAMIPVVATLVLTLPRQFPDAAALILALLPGTFATTAVLSLVSPAFADRTILPATAGWAMLLGIVPLLVLPCGSRTLIGGAFAATLALAIATTSVVQVTGAKQDYRGFTDELVAASATNIPLIVPEGWTRTAISLYRSDLAVQSPDEPVISPAVWLAGSVFDGLDPRRTALTDSGYTRLSSQSLDELTLELWVRPDTLLGTEVAPGTLAKRAATAPDGSAWRVQGSTVIDDALGVTSPSASDGPEPLTIEVERPADLAQPGQATLDLDGSPDTLFVGAVDVSPVSGQQAGTIELTCHDPTGRGLLSTRTVQNAGSPTVAVAILCPDDTVGLSLSIGVAGSGATRFSAPTVRVVPAPVPPPESG